MINEFYKEKTYAENILKNGFTSNNIKRELKVLAKYYKCEEELSPKQRENKLYSICNQYEWFKKVTHYKLIDGAVNYSRKKDSVLIEIDSINITENEINYIGGLDISDKEKKLVFCLLVIDKLNKEKSITTGKKVNNKSYFGGGDWSYRKLIGTMQTNLTYKKLHNMIGELSDKKILRIASKAMIELLFIYEIDSGDSVILKVDDFDIIGLHYDFYYGSERVKKCENINCNALIKLPSNKRSASQIKFCRDCAEENKKEQNKIADMKYKAKIKEKTKSEKS